MSPVEEAPDESAATTDTETPNNDHALVPLPPAPARADEAAIVPYDDTIQVNGRQLARIKPSVDLRDLPRKLAAADREEQDRILKAIHERFWHSPPNDMLRLLQAACLPRDLVLRGVEIARNCPHCRALQPKMHKPLVKGHFAVHFNEIVQHDIFFLWDDTFMLLIDEATRWKTGDKLENKQGPTIVKALWQLWLRFWGPMQNLLSDQEGGLLSTPATKLCDRLSINRLLVGKGGATTKGLVERHIALTKISMLKLKKATVDEGLDVSHSEICQEVCMSQNLLLEYNGGTPQMAVTGQSQRGWYTPDVDTLEAATGVLQQRPDLTERMARTRLMAKEAIIQGLIQDRLARAAKMKQHKHEPELLLPGVTVDYWRQPDRKYEDGWRGPAELKSLERMAGSAIIKHQGLPMLIPLHQLRKHILFAFHNDLVHRYQRPVLEQPCNEQLVNATADIFYHEYMTDATQQQIIQRLHSLMDIVDGTSPGKTLRVGMTYVNGTYNYTPDRQTVEKHRLLKLTTEAFKDTIMKPHGIIYGTDLRRIPLIKGARWNLVLRWNRLDRTKYYLRLHRAHHPLTFRGDNFEGFSTLCLYTFEHTEELEHETHDDIDWSDISSIPWMPDYEDDDSFTSPKKPPNNPPTQTTPPHVPPYNNMPMPLEPLPQPRSTPPTQPGTHSTPPGFPPHMGQPSVIDDNMNSDTDEFMAPDENNNYPPGPPGPPQQPRTYDPTLRTPVSYTHLTLPTSDLV